MKNIPYPTCYIIGQNPLLLACSKILRSRSFLIKGIISPSSQIQTWAHDQQIDWFHSVSDIDWDKNSADYLFSIVNNEIIPDNVLQKIQGLAINYHDASLPLYAGSNAAAWAILNGETVHGISWHIINERIDAGDVLKQVNIPLLPDETTLSLNMKCVEQALAAFSELVDELCDGTYQRIPQNQAQRTYFARSQKPRGNGWINWHSSAEDIERHWRATQWGDYINPFTTLKMVLKDDVVLVNTITVLPEPSECPPGTVLEVNDRHWKISTTTNNISLTASSTAPNDQVALSTLAERCGIKTGDVLPSATAEDLQQFQTSSQQCFPHESVWVKTLAGFEPTIAPAQMPLISLRLLPKQLVTQCRDFLPDESELPLVLLTAWIIYLQRLEGQAQVSICIHLPKKTIPDSVRPFFSSYLPLTIGVDDQNNFAQLLQQVRQSYADITQKKTYLKDIWHRYPELADATPPEQQAYRIDLDSNSAQLESESNPLPESFLYLFKQLLRQPTHAIAQIDWVTAKERQQLLVDWNSTDTPYPAEQTIHGMFEEQVRKTPEQIALITDDVQLSYQELNNKANQLAHYLIKHHAIQPDQLIAVCLERSEWMLIALLGILKSGAAYVPLDPAYPANRITHILNESDARIILTTQDQAQQLHNLPNIGWQTTKVLALDQPDFANTLAQQSFSNPVTATTSRNLAYVLYTSGTTGTPKGIQIEHQGIVNRITWMNRTYPLNPTDRVLQKTPYVFDVSVWELFWANWTGAAVVFAKPEGHKEPHYLSQLIQQERISIIHFTPTMLNGFVRSMEKLNTELTSLRHLFCSGEALNSATVKWAQALLPNVEIHNLYGPTEASIDVLFYDCISQQPVYLGKPITNMRAYVLDTQHRLLPIGTIGELHIAGDGLARGYVNQPTLTDQQFIPNPFQTEQDKQAGRFGRLYKTGDLARWLPCGNLDYHGRNDHQIKLRGYRIELGEIEQVIQRYPEIHQSVVIAHDNKLIAYYVAQQAIDDTKIQAFVSAYLPEYMVPYQFMFLKELPLSISGKVNQKKLPLPNLPYSEHIIEPDNETEKQVATVFATTLGLEQANISVTDDFFKLGGDSILALRLVSKLNQLFQKTIQVKDILELKTIRAISALLQIQEVITTESEASYVPFSLVDQSRYQNKLDLDQIEDIYPASHLQMGMLFESSLNDKGTYHDVFYYEINLSFDQEKFLKVWEALAHKHALLRARFLFSEQNSLDVVIFKEVHLHHQFYTNQPLQQLIDAERLNHFSHTEEYLFHLIVNQHTDTDSFEFIFSFHHAIVDGWSVASLINEFVQAYAYGQAVPLPGPATQQNTMPLLNYGEFVRNELRHVNDAASMAFWKDYLADFEPTQAKWKFNDIATSPDSLFTYEFLLTPDEARLAHQLAQEQAISVDSVFLYAYLKTLSFFLNSNDITIGLGFNNRLEKIGGDVLFGLFLNVLPFRLQLNPTSSLQEALSETFTKKIKLYEHKHVPYAHLKSTFDRKLYEFGFNFIHFHVLKQSEQIIKNCGGFDRTNIPFMLQVTQSDSFKVELRSHDIYIDQEYLTYFGHYFKLVLQNILQGKNGVSLDAQDYQKMVIDWNATQQPYPHEKTLHQLFEAQVERTPDAIALVYEETQLTYQELNQQSNQLAHYLLEQYQVQPDEFIALCLSRNELMVVAMLAVLKSGAAYVPIDPDYPEERIAYILRDTKTRVVLTNAIYQQKICAYSSCSVVAIDDSFNQAQFQLQTALTPTTPVTSNHLAYVTYTSGTTGKPNGVMIEHQGVVNLIFEKIESYTPHQHMHVALYSNYVFDASVHELFLTLSSGCKVFILPNPVRHDLQSLSEYFIANTIQASWIPTSLVSDFMETYSEDKLEMICTGGERLILNANINMNKLSYGLINVYGATEATVFTTYNKVIRMNDGNYNTNTIGQPIANSTCYVFSLNGQLAPVGAIGELFIGGAGLARGYLNNPNLTSQKFIQNPFQTEDEKSQGTHARLYKTGDLVRWLPDGNLEFIARNDTQVKVRSHRIELGEIENVLMTFPGIKQCAVLPVPIQSISTQSKQVIHLVAYYVKNNVIQQEDESDYLTQWENLYDYEYAQLDLKKYQENIQGWNSSYTMEPIPKNQMLEWRDATLTRIKKLKPKRILEVGCGSGLLLFNLLDQCHHYYATDISGNSVRYIQKVVNQLGYQSQVTAMKCAADVIPFDALRENYDVVILNSVIQYFPNLDYLEKHLIQLLDNMPSGRIFIGDVRDFRLLSCFHYSVLKFREMPLNWAEIHYLASREKELLISPHYFINLKKNHPCISSIQLLPKLTKATNEMSCYRYDVILCVEKCVENTEYVATKVDYTKFSTVIDLQDFVKKQKEACLYIQYPNQKIAKDYVEYQLLLDKKCDVSQEDLQHLLTIEQIQTLFNDYGYEVACHLNALDPLYLNLIVHKKGKTSEVEINYEKMIMGSIDNANSPVSNINQYNESICCYLEKYLPHYMIPQHFVSLDKLPMTVNGKLDRKALPNPILFSNDNYVAPRNEIESKLRDIFAQVLGLPQEKIGVRDNFFQIGGNSLLVFKLISKINSFSNCRIEACAIFSHKNIENLAEQITITPSHLRKEKNA